MIPDPTPELLAILKEYEDRALSREEFEARVRAPMTAREREDLEAKIAWFTRRYPTAGERIRAMQQLYDQWRHNRLQ
jgi:hypothetical protein